MNKLSFILTNLALAAMAFYAVEYKEYWVFSFLVPLGCFVQYCFYLNDKPCQKNKQKS